MKKINFGAKIDKKDKRDELYSQASLTIKLDQNPKRYLIKSWDKLTINDQKKHGSCVGQSFSKFIEHQELIKKKEIIPKRVKVKIDCQSYNRNPVIIRLNNKVLGTAPLFQPYTTYLDYQEFYNFKFTSLDCETKKIVVSPNSNLELFFSVKLETTNKKKETILVTPNISNKPNIITTLIKYIQSILFRPTYKNEVSLNKSNGYSKLSPNYVYSRCKIKDNDIRDVGTFPRSACDVLMKHGVCEDKYMPYENPIPNKVISKEADIDASNRKIHLYSKLKTDEEIKRALLKDKAVPVSITVTKSFMYFKDTKGKTDLIKFNKKEKQYGLHSVLIVGYDDDIGGWLIQNSWNQHWGEQWKVKGGRAWISYDWRMYDPYELYYK